MVSEINPASAFALVSCVLALGLALYFRRDRGLSLVKQAWRGRGRKQLTVVERTALTPHHMLHLVRFEGDDIVVATTPAGLVVLTPFATQRKDSSYAAAAGREVGE